MNKFQVNMIHYNHYHKFPQVSPVRKPVVNATAPNLSQIPPIKLPFPPTIRASDIARKRLRSRICSKSPNAFFVYRKAFVDQLSVFGENKKLKMTEVSRLVSSRWKMESKQVKAAYEEIAKQVEKELNDIRNKDLVYTDDFGIGGGRRKAKNRKRGRRSNSEFGTDAFFLNLKGGNFNISTLDFSVKPDDDNDKNHENDNSDNTDSNSSLSETSIVECKESEENSSSDESSIDNNNYISHLDSITVTINNDHNNHDNDDNHDNHNNNIQPFQQNQFDLGELTSQYYSEVGMGLNCNLNLLTPIPPLVCDDELISFYQQNGFYPNEDSLNCYMDNFDLS